MVKTAIILHGTLGSPSGNWFQWLKKELETKNFNVWLPQLPKAEQPSLREWADFVQKECPFVINSETLIVGHSSGSILALIIAQNNFEPIGGIVAVSVFHDNSLRWEPNNRLFDVNFEWGAIQANINKLLFVHSDNDPYVPLNQAQFVAGNCQAEMLVIPNQGHFNLERSKDYEAFPRLFATLERKGFLDISSKPRIVIVNENDEIIAYKKRDMLTQDDIYRVSALWVKNSKGGVLLAQRKFTKRHDPGKWGPAVAGTVDEGETYKQNIIKEAEEEIGLKNIRPISGPKVHLTGEHNYFNQWYTLVVDKLAEEFTIQEEEVEQVRWFTRAELEKDLREYPEKYLKSLDWSLENL
jgi:predicted alpha/beta hydrolase family esterase/isopentenyldiphosphate isomerase